MIPRAFWLCFWAVLMVGDLILIGIGILLMDRFGIVVCGMLLVHATGMLVHYVGEFDGPRPRHTTEA